MKARTYFLFSLGIFVLLLLLGFFIPNLKTKLLAESKDKAVSFEVDYKDIEAYSLKESVSDQKLLLRLKEIPISVISLNATASPNIENGIRNLGFKILWRARQIEKDSPWPVLNRMRTGDGVLAYENAALGFPIYLDEVVTAVMMTSGFVPLVEFSHQDGLSKIASKIPSQMVKTHCLQARETVNPNLALWEQRIIRAATGRWVRHLQIHFSPSLTFEENLQFQRKIFEELKRKGFELSLSPSSKTLFDLYQGSKSKLIKNPKGRVIFILLMAIILPLFGIWIVKADSQINFIFGFLLFSLLSTLGGVLIHAVGSDFYSIVGLRPMPGVKLELLLPFLASFPLLMKASEVNQFLQKPLRIWHVGMLMGFVLVFVALYLMRSGNHPVLPVLDEERNFRDWLEQVLWVRPRFKEFLIGHPALLIGFWLRASLKSNKNFLTDGRLWVGVGLIGQISILNSFHHFHSLFSSELLRTFHGIWLGIVFGVVGIFFLKKLTRKQV